MGAVPAPLPPDSVGGGNVRNNGDSITCVYTVAFIRGENWIFIVTPFTRGKRGNKMMKITGYHF